MGVKHCAWGECTSDSRLYHKDSMSGVTFIRFPKPHNYPEKCDRWIKACSRGDGFGRHRITNDTYVCSLHFVGKKGPTYENPDPLPATARPLEVSLLSKRKRPAPKERISATITKEKIPKLTSSSSTGDNPNAPVENDLGFAVDPEENRGHLQQDSVQLFDEHNYCSPQTLHTQHAQSQHAQGPVIDNSTGRSAGENIPSLSVCDASTQTCLDSTHLADYSDQCLQDPQLLRRHLTIKDIMKDDKSCKFYTGIANLQLLMLLFSLLKDKAERLTLWRGEENVNCPTMPTSQRDGPRSLKTFEAFLLTLVRLRRGMDIEHLADCFGVSCATVSRYFRTWLEFMSRELEFLLKWQSPEKVRSNVPKSFKHFKKTVAIIDCTEFFVQKPSLPSCQRITWSQYKSHNTFKSLVSISPNGSFNYVSELWTGSVSDRRITQECGFLDMLQYGDDVMADRGFLIRDLVTLRGATLNIPPFAHGKQLTSSAVTKTRRIASARIHVERAIGRLKNFKILQGILPLKSKKILNRMVRLCAQLCNLDKALVK